MENINWKKNLVAVWASQYLSLAGFGLCMPFIPLFMKDCLGIEDMEKRILYMSIFTGCGLVSLCIANFCWGMLADKWGRKLMLLRASYGAGLLYPLMVFSPDVYTLIAFRTLASFFSGTVNPAQTLLVSTTPKEHHGYVLGVLSTATWSGNMTGYLIGGTIVEFFGYRTAFFCCSALYIIGGLIVQFMTRENFHAPVKSGGKKRRTFIDTIMVPGVLSLMFMFLLMGAGRRLDQPFTALLIEEINGVDKAAFLTGVVSSCSAVGGVVSGFAVGYMCDRYSPAKLLLPCVLLAVLGQTWQGFSSGVTELCVARFIAYFAGGGMQPILLTMLARCTSEELRGTFFGWSASVNVAGGIFASQLSGAVGYTFGLRAIFFTAALLLLSMLIPGYKFIRRAWHGSAAPGGSEN